MKISYYTCESNAKKDHFSGNDLDQWSDHLKRSVNPLICMFFRGDAKIMH